MALLKADCSWIICFRQLRKGSGANAAKLIHQAGFALTSWFWVRCAPTMGVAKWHCIVWSGMDCRYKSRLRRPEGQTVQTGQMGQPGQMGQQAKARKQKEKWILNPTKSDCQFLFFVFQMKYNFSWSFRRFDPFLKFLFKVCRSISGLLTPRPLGQKKGLQRLYKARPNWVWNSISFCIFTSNVINSRSLRGAERFPGDT